MILLENLTKEETNRIGKEIAIAFMAEDGSFPRNMKKGETIAYFQAMVKMLVKCHCLYELEEGGAWISWFHKKQGPSLMRKILFSLDLNSRISINHMNAFLENVKDWEDYEHRYRKEKDYIDIFTLAVSLEKQGQGLLKKLLKDPMAEAEDKGCLCILDTDSRLKKEKYEHLGFHVSREGVCPDGTEMFTMVYDPKEK